MEKTIIVALLTSTGIWTLISYLIQTQLSKDSAQSKMLKGLGHDRICYLGAKYIEQGYITKDDYENLHDYLYAPYKDLGGNGTAAKIMEEVGKLPMETTQCMHCKKGT